MALSRTSFAGDDTLEVAEVEVTPFQTLLQYLLHSLGSHYWRKGERERGRGVVNECVCGEGGRKEMEKSEGGIEEERKDEKNAECD